MTHDNFETAVKRSHPQKEEINTDITEPATVEGSELEEVEVFPYLGSVINKQGG